MANLQVRVQPGAARSQVVGFEGDVLRVRIAAPPSEGRANAALCAYLAEVLGVRQSRVSLLRGERGRVKLVAVEGLDDAELRRLLPAE